MGLREKASDFSKHPDRSHTLPDLYLKPSEGKKKQAPKELPEINAEPIVPPEKPAQPVTSHRPDKLETVLSLLELFKEFGEAETEDDLWQILVYSLLGQLGSRDIAIFLFEDGRLSLKAFHGFVLQKDFLYPAKPAIIELLRDGQSKPASEITGALTEAEKQFFTSLNIQTVTPVRRYEEFRGLLMTGKPSAGQTLIKDDYYYLRLCGELLGSFEKQLRRMADSGQREALARETVETATQIAKLTDSIRLSDQQEEITTQFKKLLADKFQIDVFLFLSRDQFTFTPIASGGLPAETVQTFELSSADNWVESVTSSGEWFVSREYQNKEELYQALPESDRKYLKICAVLPLAIHGETHGIFVSFYREETVTPENLRNAGICITAFYYNYVTQKMMRPTPEDLSANPVQALRSILAEREDELKRTGTPFALMVIDMANLSRLKNLYGDSFLKTARDKTHEIILQHAGPSDFLTEVFHGHFIGVYPGQENGDVFRLSRIVQREIGKVYPDEDTRPLFSVKIYARPFNERIPWEMLFKAN